MLAVQGGFVSTAARHNFKALLGEYCQLCEGLYDLGHEPPDWPSERPISRLGHCMRCGVDLRLYGAPVEGVKIMH